MDLPGYKCLKLLPMSLKCAGRVGDIIYYRRL